MTPRRLWGATSIALPVILAAALGAWGLNFGLPFAFRPDEEILVGRAVSMVVRHSLDPLFYNYPPLGIWAFAAAEWVLGIFSHLGPATDVDPSLEYLAARAVSVLAFAATVLFTALAGRAAYGPAAGALAGTGLAVAPLMVQQAHFGRVDMPAEALVAVAIWQGGRAAGLRGWALAGAAAGLAGATKYTAGVVVVYVLLRLLLDPAPGRLRRLGAAAGASVATFLLVLLPAGNPVKLAQGIGFLGGRALGSYGSLPIGLVYHPTVSLPVGLGGGLYLLAVAGLGLALLRRRPADLALAGCLAAMLAVVGFTHEVFFRYVLPLLPPLALLAGGLLRDAAPLRSPSTLLAAVAALLLLPSLFDSVSGDRLLTATDTRVLAAAWLDANAPPGSELKLDSYWSEPFYDAAAVQSEPLHPLYLAGDRVADSFQLGRYTGRYKINSPGAACYVVAASQPPGQAPPSPSPRRSPLATFRPYPAGPYPGGVYDPLDSFFLPLSGFGDLRRPGPEIVISAC